MRSGEVTLLDSPKGARQKGRRISSIMDSTVSSMRNRRILDNERAFEEEIVKRLRIELVTAGGGTFPLQAANILDNLGLHQQDNTHTATCMHLHMC